MPWGCRPQRWRRCAPSMIREMRKGRRAGLPWSAGIEGLRFGSLLISFQRFVRPDDNVIDAVPSSLGALPVAHCRGAFLLPLSQEEAFWVGVIFPASKPAKKLELTALHADGRSTPAATLDGPGAKFVPGLKRADGKSEAFSRPWLAGLRVQLGKHAAHVRLVDPEAYTTLTGGSSVAPLDESAGYGGWRLP
jgi:hypothetical protein